MTCRLAVDTSALMMPVEVGVRLFEELDRLCGDYEAVVPSAVRAELDSMAGGSASGEPARAARVGRDLAERCRTVDHESPRADDALVELAERGAADACVTNDGPLRERLLDAGVPVIHLRGRNQLQRTQP